MPTRWAVFGGLRLEIWEPEGPGRWPDIVDVAGGPDGLIFVGFDSETPHPVVLWGKSFQLNPSTELTRELLDGCGFWRDCGAPSSPGPAGHWGMGICEPCMYTGGRQAAVGMTDPGDWAVFVGCCSIRGDLWGHDKDTADPSGGLPRLMEPDTVGPVIMPDIMGLYPAISVSH